MYYISFLVIITLFFSGCTIKAPEVESFKKQESNSLKLASGLDKTTLKEKFNLAQDTLELRSKWFERDKALDLTIFVASQDDKISNKLYNFLQKIAAEKTILDTLGYGKISNKYNSIQIVKYDFGSDEAQKVDAAYAHRLYDKKSLNDILRLENKREYQELSISVDTDALEESKFKIEGYKTVKYEDKKLNSFYYELVKNDISGVDEEMIIHAVIAALKISIPEYISIDRDDIKSKKVLKIVNQKANGSYLGTVYKMRIDNAIDKLQKTMLQEIELNPQEKKRIEAQYKKKIEKVNRSRKWISYQSKQLLFTTPISQRTLDVLKEQEYLHQNYDAQNINIEQAKEISKVLSLEIPDHYLTLSFPTYQGTLNQFEINIGKVTNILDTYFIKSVHQVESDSQSETAQSTKNVGTAFANGLITTLAIIGKVQLDTMAYSDAKYTYVEPEKQRGEFYPTSMFAYKDIGIETIFEKDFGHFDHSLFTVPAGKAFFMSELKDEIAFYDDNKTKVTVYDINKAKKLRTVDAQIFKDFVKATFNYKNYKIYDNLLNNPRYQGASFKVSRDSWTKMRDKFEVLANNAPRLDFKYFANSGGSQTTSHSSSSGCREVWHFTKQKPRAGIPIYLDGRVYLQFYRCNPYIDLFDKDGNFITRNEEHEGSILDIQLINNKKYIVSLGQVSSKIWSTAVFEFIAEKF